MSAQVSPTPPHDGGPSNPDRVIAHAHADGRLAITLPSLLVSDLDPLEDWWLLGRVQMRTDLPSDLKINVIAHHRHTGQLVRAYMGHPHHPDGLDPLDYSSDPEDLPGYAAWQQQWDQEGAARRYATDKPLWDKLSALPEITDVFIGTLKDLS
ncbi:hypothetical protein [Mycolicibacterium fortuitum]